MLNGSKPIYKQIVKMHEYTNTEAKQFETALHCFFFLSFHSHIMLSLLRGNAQKKLHKKLQSNAFVQQEV